MTSRYEDPDDFSDGRRVTTCLRKLLRNVTRIGAVQPGSQCTEVAAKRLLGRVLLSQDQMGESPGRWWSAGDSPDTSGRW